MGLGPLPPSVWFQIAMDGAKGYVDHINRFDQLCDVESRLFQRQPAPPVQFQKNLENNFQTPMFDVWHLKTC